MNKKQVSFTWFDWLLLIAGIIVFLLNTWGIFYYLTIGSFKEIAYSAFWVILMGVHIVLKIKKLKESRK